MKRDVARGDATCSRFLVVDDELLVRRALGRMLGRRGEPVFAANVLEARRLIATSGSWAAIVADLRLPDGSGLDVIAHFRRVHPDAPALLLTGHVEGPAVNAAFRLGADVLSKPVDSALIWQFLEKRGVSARDEVEEDATLDARIERMRHLLARSQEALTRYTIGAIIARLKREPHGARSVLTAARALGEDLPSLYRYAKVAERWTEAEVRELLSRTSPEGHKLAWSHLVLLAPIDCEATRARYVERTLDEGLSVRALTSVLAES